MDFAGHSVCPSLDAGEETFDARAVAADTVSLVVDGARVVVNLEVAAGSLAQNRHEVFRAGQDVNVAVNCLVLAIQIARQPFVGFAGDRRERKAPAETEGAVASARVV